MRIITPMILLAMIIKMTMIILNNVAHHQDIMMLKILNTATAIMTMTR